MWPSNPTTLPALNLNLPEIPPRSRLYALRPVGIGTDRVESLSSYVTRLARAHAVSPRRMIREEFKKACRAPERLRFAVRRVDCLGTLDGLGQHAETFVALTTGLTTVSAVRYLTLLSLAKLLPHNGAGLLSRHPRWCPDCLAEMFKEGEGVSRPLVWSLDLYRVCHRHRRPLVAACGGCGKVQPFVPIYPDLAHCVHCSEPLGRDTPSAPKAPVAPMERWVAESLADLVARFPDLDGIVDRDRFIAFLTTAIEELAGGNRTGFCKQLGLLPWTVKNWLTRGERPSLPQILAIGYGLGVRPAAMFLQREASITPPQTLPAKIRERAAPPRLDATERGKLSQALADIANDPCDTRSLAELSRTLGFSRTCLKYWFPDECTAVRRKHLFALLQAASERRVADHQKVANAVREVANRGEYPSARKVSGILSRHGLMLLRPDVTEAYRRAVEETLGGYTCGANQVTPSLMRNAD